MGYKAALDQRQEISASFLWAQDQLSAYSTLQSLDVAKVAIANNDLAKFESLIARGLPLCATEASTGKSLMHIACAAGALDIVKYLVVNSSTLKDSVDNEGATPLQMALENDMADTAAFMTSIGCLYVTYRMKPTKVSDQILA